MLIYIFNIASTKTQYFILNTPMLILYLPYNKLNLKKLTYEKIILFETLL